MGKVRSAEKGRRPWHQIAVVRAGIAGIIVIVLAAMVFVRRDGNGHFKVKMPGLDVDTEVSAPKKGDAVVEGVTVGKGDVRATNETGGGATVRDTEVKDGNVTSEVKGTSGPK